MQYMEFSLYERPFRFWWPEGTASFNPLAISDEITAANLEAYVLAQCAARSRRILELGTQYGLYSTIMSYAMPGHGQLVGLEILPHNAQISNENLKLNGLHGKAIVLHAAVADREGYAPLTIDLHQENASVLGNAGPIHGIGTMDVPHFRVDRLQAFHGSFDMLKMDIEGFEGNILKCSDVAFRDFSIAAIEVHPHLMYHVYEHSPLMFIEYFNCEDYAGFALIGADGRWTCHDIEATIFSKGMTVNLFLFKRAVHEAFAASLRQVVEQGLAKIDAASRQGAAMCLA